MGDVRICKAGVVAIFAARAIEVFIFRLAPAAIVVIDFENAATTVGDPNVGVGVAPAAAFDTGSA